MKANNILETEVRKQRNYKETLKLLKKYDLKGMKVWSNNFRDSRVIVGTLEGLIAYFSQILIRCNQTNNSINVDVKSTRELEKMLRKCIDLNVDSIDKVEEAEVDAYMIELMDYVSKIFSEEEFDEYIRNNGTLALI